MRSTRLSVALVLLLLGTAHAGFVEGYSIDHLTGDYDTSGSFTAYELTPGFYRLTILTQTPSPEPTGHLCVEVDYSGFSHTLQSRFLTLGDATTSDTTVRVGTSGTEPTGFLFVSQVDQEYCNQLQGGGPLSDYNISFALWRLDAA